MASVPPVGTEPNSAQAIYEIIAKHVRADSIDRARLTPVENLGPLFPQMTPEEIVNYLTEMYEIEEYGDIRATMSPGGAVSLYTTSCFTPEQAAKRSTMDEVHSSVAANVRDESAHARLTPIAGLDERLRVSPDELQDHLTSLLTRPDYADLHSLVGPNGIRYLYSENTMTEAYATLLARADAKDPSTMIAETVREESRIYPRPTKVTLFYEPVFQVEGLEMQDVVEMTMARPDCADIKKIVATTGAVYLYSDRYMPAGQAERWIEWEEVERYKNP